MSIRVRLLSSCLAGALLAGPAAAARAQEAVKPPSPTDVVYAALRTAKLSGEVATVSNLALKRDAGTLTLRSGELYFLAPVDGRVTGAVFVGDGEFTLTPPTENEKQALSIYTKTPSIAEPFSELVLRFTDKTYDEVKAKTTLATSGAQLARAQGLYDDNVNLLTKKFRANVPLRELSDIYSKDDGQFFAAFIKGQHYNKLLYLVDPRGAIQVAPEQVELLSYGDADGGIWTSFNMENRPASAVGDTRAYDITQHDISVTMKGTEMACTDKVALRISRDGVRVLPFDLYPALRVSRVTDASGAEVPFVQQPKEEDADFAVILPAPAAAGTDLTLTVEYAGKDAVRDSGGGNFILVPRSTWYPNNGSTAFGDRARFRMRFVVPNGNTIVGTGGRLEAETKEGDLTVSKWTSGDTDLAVAGFNYGKFKRKDVKDDQTGLSIEFYANTQLPDELRQMQHEIEEAEAQGVKTQTTLGSLNTTKMADSALADAENATRLYTAYFGKLPYDRIAMSQQPAGFFGQAWPTLVYMPFTAYLDATYRTQMMGTRMGTNTFFKYVGPHELAHQWWGHTVGWTSYRDQWMSEGFAEFSASVYVQKVYGQDKFIDFWEDHRKQITTATPQTEGKAPYTIGPVTQGYRLSGAKTGNVYNNLVYPKGAYILQMVRMMMYDWGGTGDEKFIAMMKDFIQTHYNKDVSTEDFKQIVEKHITPTMDLDKNRSMNWFFDEWVYGTEMPSYRLEYSVQDRGGQPTLVGKATQSGVGKNFIMLVPLYADFGKGWQKLATVTMVGNTELPFEIKLPVKPKAASLNALNDVLCLKNEAVASK